MATFYTKVFECDFQNMETNKVSRTGLLEVSSEAIGASAFMKIDFQDLYFQEDGERHIFSPMEQGEYGSTPGYYYQAASYVTDPNPMYYEYMQHPKFIIFDSYYTGYENNFISSSWSTLGWTPPDSDLPGFIQNLKDSYERTPGLPDSVNLYIMKIINLKMEEPGLSTATKWIPIFYKGNDPAI